MILTNSEVQNRFSKALDVLRATTPPRDTYDKLTLELLIGGLELGKAYSASGNAIPGLGGRGLDELLQLCDLIISGSYSPTRHRLNFKHLALGLAPR